MAEWRRVTPIARGIWSITEAGHVTMWLIVGSERALLLDTGMGFVPVRPVVEVLTALPVLVVNSHHHFDHVGGNHEFDEVLIHPYGVDRLASSPPPSELHGYLDQYDRVLAAAASVRDVDHELLHLFDADSDPAPLPPGFDRDGWQIGPSRPRSTVGDGDRLDLGGRVLEVLHTPGHTPDGICLHDSSTGILFAGDTVSSGPIYAHEPDSDVADFTASAARLAAMKDDVSLVAMSHFGRVTAPPYILQSVADAFADLAYARHRVRRVRDAVGDTVDEITFDHFSITTRPS
ncbi:MBL fold metallo-hydrolase [Rhodococcus sp. NPDC003318]|uniref:MBL fold metallo-hydrolase n=1 Tax=Rhodococcus sp. NPDC003318 TaxID=3364503 RepID=UPI0036C913D2